VAAQTVPARDQISVNVPPAALKVLLDDLELTRGSAAPDTATLSPLNWSAVRFRLLCLQLTLEATSPGANRTRGPCTPGSPLIAGLCRRMGTVDRQAMSTTVTARAVGVT